MMDHLKKTLNRLANFSIFFIFSSSLALAQENEFSTQFKKPLFNLEIDAFNIKEETLLSRGSGTLLETQIVYEIDPSFKINFTPIASLTTGQQTSRDPQSPLTNSLYLKEANLDKTFFSILKIKIGALYQKEFLPGLSGYSKSFPGIGILIPFNYSNHELTFIAMGAVPTSSGLATTSDELESNSSLLSGTINLKSDWTKNFSTTLTYSHFRFDKLSSAMATDSLERGNTVVKINSSSGYFVYKYAGDEVVLKSQMKFLDQFDVKIKMNYIKNSLAPNRLSTGYDLELAPGFKNSDGLTIRPFINHYHVNADAMVSIFVDSSYGRTNRDGYKYGFGFEKNNYVFNLNYSRSTLIQNNPFQSDDESFFLSLNLNNLHF
jgi:hypothetical protein